MNETIAIVRQRVADYAHEHPRVAMVRRGGVRICAEFERIDALPRRAWSADATAELVQRLSAILRKPGGKQTLRPIQAIALYEIAAYRGLLGPIGVGEGKTLITLLAPVVLGSKKPLLILPAKLIEKTRQEMIALSSDWRIASNVTVVSYEWLGRVQAARFLEGFDSVTLDEAHKARNRKAAVTRRILRYTEKHEHIPFICLSGTLIKKRVADWASLGKAALGMQSPAPHKWTTVEHWGGALDLNAMLSPGALSRWAEDGEHVREGYRRRVVETPGVVATTEASVDVGLNAEAWSCDIGPRLTEALEKLEDSWQLPDGFILTDPLGYYRAARQLALGCFYRWKEQPPEEWREARRLWSAFVREACRRVNSRPPYDSELQVRQAVESGALPGREVLDRWAKVKDTFKPEIEHVWVTSAICEALVAAARDEDDPAIVWIETVAVGHMMNALGLPYFGKQSRAVDGEYIAQAKGPIAASIQSCSEGHNLQDRWARNIISAPLQDATRWEQLLGRTHRQGQQADEVTVQVAMLGHAHRESWTRAREHARYLEQMTGQRPKLLQMTLVDLPDRDDE